MPALGDRPCGEPLDWPALTGVMVISGGGLEVLSRGLSGGKCRASVSGCLASALV